MSAIRTILTAPVEWVGWIEAPQAPKSNIGRWTGAKTLDFGAGAPLSNLRYPVRGWLHG